MTLFVKIKSFIQLATVLFSLFTNFVSIYLVINHSPTGLCGSFCSTIYAIAINFVYRFFALEREGRLQYFSGKLLVIWILIPIVSAILWVTNNSIWLSPNPELNDYMRNRTREKYDLDIDRTSYTACLYWRIDQNGNQVLSWKDMIGALGLYHMMTLIPMTFLFFPIGIFLTSPLIGIDIEWASLPITFLYAFYPAVDPIPNMIFIEEYRLAVYNWIRRLLRKNQVASVVSYELTTDVV
ncbi:hypothetical protein B9Z55_017432 [Caenorhabditis nigoni]|uniref:Uncharacterized protein n=1 Tax=Caenorhabditis nigoni TaxID=1611254 RepID=A0A2G5TA09_9PELO|nr:hypothetical protein B9Z55_017432 [Caenorhabditis nigoni]